MAVRLAGRGVPEGVLLDYAGGRLTPESAAEETEHFRMMFECAVKDPKNFAKANPAIFQELCGEIAESASPASAAV